MDELDQSLRPLKKGRPEAGEVTEGNLGLKKGSEGSARQLQVMRKFIKWG